MKRIKRLLLAVMSVTPLMAIAPQAYAASAPTHLKSGHVSSSSSATTSSFSVSNSNLVAFIWSAKGSDVSLTGMSFSAGTWEPLNNYTNYYDSAGTTKASMGFQGWQCVSGCTNVTATYTFSTSLSAIDYSVENVGSSFVNSFHTNGSSNGVTHLLTGVSVVAGNVKLSIGAHEANEKTNSNYASGTWTELAAPFGTGNNSLGVSYAVVSGNPTSPAQSGSSWSTSVPGGVMEIELQ